MTSDLRARQDAGRARERAAALAPIVRWSAALGGWRRHATVDNGLLALALGVATALRMFNLGGVGLNSDEAVYAAQAASMSGNPHFTPVFPVVRAHPLLLQMLMSPLYRSGVPDTAGRYVAAGFGIATVLLVYVLGRVLYDRRVGAVAALLLAVMPYHVTISRQILLDGPMTFFATGALTCLALGARTERRRWFVAAGACLGMAALSKETAIILLGSCFVFLSLANQLWRPVRFLLAGVGLALGIAWSYPLLTVLAGGARSGQSYLLWQLTRQPNHSFGFYLVDVGGAIGFVLLAVIAVDLLARRVSSRPYSWRETLLLAWAGVPVLFFQVWPVKGFSYLLPIAPVVALLAARALCPSADRVPSRRRGIVSAAVLGVCLAVLAVPSVRGVVSPATSGLAGAGGTPGGREAGRWVAANVPQGAQLMTIGPSMANIIQYYSGRRSDGLSVSPNPLHRNPTYQPILNADAALKSGHYQYVVWDAYSAGRSDQFAARALELAHRFHGQIVHVQSGRLHGKSGQQLIVIYKVTP
jgi:hypothetical protein